jgi:hypothetical protein
MLLLDTSFLIEFEDELTLREPAHGVLARHRRHRISALLLWLVP